MPSLGLRIQALALLALAACGDSERPFGQLWTSAHFRYWTRPNQTFTCPDLLPLLESHGQAIHDALGIEWPADRVVDYYLFNGPDDLTQHGHCGGASGCAPGTTVESLAPFQRHELVHAYLRPLGLPPPMVLEGAAEAMSCWVSSYPRPTGDWRTAFNGCGDILYGGGSWLVGHLLRRYDRSLFLQLYADVPFNASADEFEARFNAIYPNPIDVVWNETLAAANRPALCAWECAQPALPLDGALTHPPALCGQTTLAQTVRTTQASAVHLDLPGDTFARLENCEGAELPPIFFSGSGVGRRFELVALLPAGTTAVLTGPGIDKDGVRASASTGSDDPACGATPTIALGDADVRYVIMPPPPLADWSAPPPAQPAPLSVRLSLPAANPQAQVNVYDGDGASARACPSCQSDAASCLDILPTDLGVSAPANDGAVLRAAPVHPLTLIVR